MPAELRLLLLGGAGLTLGGRPVRGVISTKAQALVCYLAATGRSHARPALASLLWGELDDAAAAANLRVVLSNLNRLLGPQLVISRQTVGLNPVARQWTDVAAFERLTAPTASIAQLQEGVVLYRGDLLDEFIVRNAPVFDEWLTGRREWLRQRAIQAFWRLSAAHIEAGAFPAAIDALSRLLTLEAWLEDAHRRMIGLLAADGQRSAALAQYESCRRILADELGVEPAAETTLLAERARRGAAPLVLPPAPADLLAVGGD